MWPNPQFLAGLVTFTEEILNEKLHFLCSENNKVTSYRNLLVDWELEEKSPSLYKSLYK